MKEYRLPKAPSFSRRKGRLCSINLAVFLLAWVMAAISFADAFVNVGTRPPISKKQKQQQQQQQQQQQWTATFLRESTSETANAPETNLPTAAQWQSHVSTHPEGIAALEQIWENVSNKEENNFGLAFLFVGQAHAKDFEKIVEKASKKLDNNKNCQLVSVLGGGVIGENVELDQIGRPSMSLLVGSLPDGAKVEVSEYNPLKTDKPFRLDESIRSCLVFSDPYVPMEEYLSGDLDFGDRIVAGGISCPLISGQATLGVGNKCLSQGTMVVVGFAGSIKLQCLVAQGSRPIGKIYTITASQYNLITELDNEPAVDVLTNFVKNASDEEKALIRSGFLCGIAKEGSSDEKDIDFLTRQIIGTCPDPSGIAIGASNVRKDDLFCFQVLNRKSSEQDLEIMVSRAKTARLFDNTAGGNSRPMAALQISCVARGRDMFDGVPNVDLSNIRELVDDRPVVGGFYANGEIGPVGLSGFSTTSKDGNGESYVHGFTTVAVLLCEDQPLPTKSDESSTSSKDDSPLDAWG